MTYNPEQIKMQAIRENLTEDVWESAKLYDFGSENHILINFPLECYLILDCVRINGSEKQERISYLRVMHEGQLRKLREILILSRVRERMDRSWNISGSVTNFFDPHDDFYFKSCFIGLPPIENSSNSIEPSDGMMITTKLVEFLPNKKVLGYSILLRSLLNNPL